jgi:hypothetical protein
MLCGSCHTKVYLLTDPQRGRFPSSTGRPQVCLVSRSSLSFATESHTLHHPGLSYLDTVRTIKKLSYIHSGTNNQGTIPLLGNVVLSMLSGINYLASATKRELFLTFFTMSLKRLDQAMIPYKLLLAHTYHSFPKAQRYRPILGISYHVKRKTN